MIFSIFVVSIVTSMMLLNGDVIINDAVKNTKKAKLLFHKNSKIVLAITGLIIILWLSEPYHKISAANVA